MSIMSPDLYIDTLLKKYRKAPSFPFEDWVENPVSFYALINIWDEIFSVAAGQKKHLYEAYGEVKRDIDSSVYQVIHKAERKKFEVTHEPIGGTFYLITHFDPFDSDDESKDMYTLGIVSDLDRTRLICCFNIIRHFTHTPITCEADRKEMENLFISSYSQYFKFPDYDPFAPRDEDESDD